MSAYQSAFGMTPFLCSHAWRHIHKTWHPRMIPNALKVNKRSKNFDETPHRRYWGFNDPICCEHRSRDCKRFWMGWTTTTIAASCADSQPHLIHSSMGPRQSALKRHLDRFSRFCRARERDQRTHRQTHRDRPTDWPCYSVCSNSQHPMQCLRRGLIIVKQIVLLIFAYIQFFAQSGIRERKRIFNSG